MQTRELRLRSHELRIAELSRQNGELSAMIADFQRNRDELDIQIKVEELRAGNRDPSHFNYPLVAKSLRARRDKLSKSVDELKRRLVRSEAEIAQEQAERDRLMLSPRSEEAVPAVLKETGVHLAPAVSPA